MKALRLVLASRSPQRSMLLDLLGMPYRVVVSTHDEDHLDGDPVKTVEENARGKAEEVLARVRLGAGELVLGVDTVVVLEGRVLGKAGGEDQARSCLAALAGRRHEVFSGLHLCDGGGSFTGHAVTGVTFRPLALADIDRYVTSGEWRDRAGAYAIQGLGSALVASVDGDYFNVVGLPVPLLIEGLSAFGTPLLGWLAPPG
jgi:septum formation protein